MTSPEAPASSGEAPAPVLLVEPAEGVPPVVETPAALAAAVKRLSAGTGPVAVDAERASGYRYSQRAYLVQLRRRGSGTVLVDPVPLGDLGALGDALAGDTPVEWVLHAAGQDLPCLADAGMRPRLLFDTELAGRLAGFERVGLGAMVESVLGYALEKGHSAVDWSRRPLPIEWLRYAALDVELLIDLRDALEAELDRQGKLAWAREEFAAIVEAPPKAVAAEPWRRTSGIHRVRDRRTLAAVRALWEARDRVARSRDLAPGRVLPDSAIVAAALARPADIEELLQLPVFSGPRMRRSARTWWSALAAAAALPEQALPRMGAGAGAPPAGRWADRDPAAAGRLARCRAALAALADTYDIPVENLVEPAVVRRLAWEPPVPAGAASAASVDGAAGTTQVAAALAEGGARRWQIALVAADLAKALDAS